VTLPTPPDVRVRISTEVGQIALAMQTHHRVEFDVSRNARVGQRPVGLTHRTSLPSGTVLQLVLSRGHGLLLVATIRGVARPFYWPGRGATGWLWRGSRLEVGGWGQIVVRRH